MAAIDVPGLSAINLVSTLQNFQPSAQTEAAVAEQEQALLAHGAEGQAVLDDIDTFIEGINAYLDFARLRRTRAGRETTSSP